MSGFYRVESVVRRFTGTSRTNQFNKLARAGGASLTWRAAAFNLEFRNQNLSLLKDLVGEIDTSCWGLVPAGVLRTLSLSYFYCFIQVIILLQKGSPVAPLRTYLLSPYTDHSRAVRSTDLTTEMEPAPAVDHHSRKLQLVWIHVCTFVPIIMLVVWLFTRCFCNFQIVICFVLALIMMFLPQF